MPSVRFSVVPLCLALAFALGGCGGGKTVAKLTCPVAFIAPNLDSYTVLRQGAAPSNNPNDIAFGVKLTDVSSNCHSEVTGVRVTTKLTFVAARNDPDLRQSDFSYFVAVADGQQNILAKQNFALRVDFAPRQKQMRIFEEITTHLPTKDNTVAGTYGVVVGMQLDKQQLDLNRQR